LPIVITWHFEASNALETRGCLVSFSGDSLAGVPEAAIRDGLVTVRERRHAWLSRKPVAKPRKAGKLASSSRRVPAHQDNQENDANLTRGESDRCGNNPKTRVSRDCFERKPLP